mmetsp:Transcript_67748/g.175988  ORF Transcript_67748/g.175988 Transcript_67748/m.175988 type:complete len:436 (+) Transcript_67748:63-1370(+)
MWSTFPVALAGAAVVAAGHTAPISDALLSSALADLLTHADVSQGPRIAPAWTANVTQLFGASTLGYQVGSYAYDQAGRRWRSTLCSNNTIFHASGDTLCFDQLSVDLHGASPFGSNMTAGAGDGAICRTLPLAFYDQFALLALGKKTGSSSVAGVPCDLWYAASTTKEGQNITASACVAADGVPREFNMTTGMAYKAVSEIKYTFSNPHIGALSDDVFAPSAVCASKYPMPACEGGSKQALTLYRVHGKAEPYSLVNRNAGDALGDMAFFCDIIGMDATQVVTEWAVEVDSAWGQYAFCLFQGGKNVCWGHTGKHVGRESSLGLGGGAAQGQCSRNEETGSWISFPDVGECPAGAAVGTNGCTWIATPVRSVLAGCIIKHRGLQEMCAQERGHAPMLRSAAIFAAALETSDPAKGGCPDASASGPGSSISSWIVV